MKITVKATKWHGGWELEIDENQHTQSTTLANARQQIIDYLDTVDEAIDHSGWEIEIIPQIENRAEIELAREKTRQAEAQQKEAAMLSRKIARDLRASGFSVSDTAAIMGVSRGRISQLTA